MLSGKAEAQSWRDSLALAKAWLCATRAGVSNKRRSAIPLTTRKTGAGNVSRSCESPTQVIQKLHDQAGIEAAGATAARCTFVVRLHRKGYDLRHIREVLGLADPVGGEGAVRRRPSRSGSIVAKVI